MRCIGRCWAQLLVCLLAASSLFAGDLRGLKLSVQRIEPLASLTIADGRTLELKAQQQLLLVTVVGTQPDDTRIPIPIAGFRVTARGETTACLALGFERPNDSRQFFPAGAITSLSTNGNKGASATFLLVFAVPKDADQAELTFAVNADNDVIPVRRTSEPQVRTPTTQAAGGGATAEPVRVR